MPGVIIYKERGVIFMKLAIREPINALTHLVGAVLSGIGLIVLLVLAVHTGSWVKILSAVVFCLGLIGLYTASTVYHWQIKPQKVLDALRRLDHMMIFVLIAATYTPICLITLKGFVGYLLLSIIWTLTILGVVMKFFWMNAPRWLSTSIYLLMGWAAAFVIYPIYKNMDLNGLILLFAGGLSYSIGGVIYGLKSQRLKIGRFGFHEIFHIYILLGSFFHYMMISLYVI